MENRTVEVKEKEFLTFLNGDILSDITKLVSVYYKVAFTLLLFACRLGIHSAV